MLLKMPYNLNKSTSLTPNVLKEYVNKFWSEVYAPLHSSNNNQHLMLICKVKFKQLELGYKTLKRKLLIRRGGEEFYS